VALFRRALYWLAAAGLIHLSCATFDGSYSSTQTAGRETASSGFQPVYVYSDHGSFKNHFYPTGLMGDHEDIVYHDGYSQDTVSGNSCIAVIYKAKAEQHHGWVGMYWQNPAYNWGYKDGGLNLSGASRLTFWARGDKGTEKIEKFCVGGTKGSYSDSCFASIGPFYLTKQWKQYEIDLSGKDLSSVIGGFCWSINAQNNPQGALFYLDEIRYE
jgi:hypothetical protein